MLDELLAIVETGEFEDNGWLHLRAASWTSESLELTLAVDPGDGSSETFLLRCIKVIEYHLAAAADRGFNHWSSDHPALDQYTQPREQLYFGASPASTQECVGQLWLAHHSYANNWVPFDRYLNTEVALDHLLTAGHGLLAAGPRGLLSVYAEVLERLACAPNSVLAHDEAPHRRAEMVHFGESFVVSESLELARTAV